MLTDLQTQCKERLESVAFFSAQPAITVLVETLKDIQNEIERRLARLGLAVVILTPQLSTRLRAPGVYPAWDRVSVVASVLENVTINRAATGIGQPASLVAEACAYYLHGWAPAITGNKLIVESVNLVEDPTNLIYNVSLFTGGVTANAPIRI
jgi:hypothetical protein